MRNLNWTLWGSFVKQEKPALAPAAIDSRTAQVLASVFGRGTAEVFLQLQKLLLPFGIKRYYTDAWGAEQRHLQPKAHELGKRKTHTIEQQYLRLSTRIKWLVPKTILVSKIAEMHAKRDWTVEQLLCIWHISLRPTPQL